MQTSDCIMSFTNFARDTVKDYTEISFLLRGNQWSHQVPYNRPYTVPIALRCHFLTDLVCSQTNCFKTMIHRKVENMLPEKTVKMESTELTQKESRMQQKQAIDIFPNSAVMWIINRKWDLYITFIPQFC